MTNGQVAFNKTTNYHKSEVILSTQSEYPPHLHRSNKLRRWLAVRTAVKETRRAVVVLFLLFTVIESDNLGEWKVCCGNDFF